MSVRKKTKELPPVLDTVRYYTDGSAVTTDDRPGGWGLYEVHPDGTEHMYSGRDLGTTVSRMEMTAMLKALKLGLEGGVEFNIYSDSAMVVNSINKGWLKNWAFDNFLNRTNSDIWKPIWNVLKDLRRSRIKYGIHHMNGHLTDLSHPHILGNNYADALADYKDR